MKLKTQLKTLFTIAVTYMLILLYFDNSEFLKLTYVKLTNLIVYTTICVVYIILFIKFIKSDIIFGNKKHPLVDYRKDVRVCGDVCVCSEQTEEDDITKLAHQIWLETGNENELENWNLAKKFIYKEKYNMDI